LMVQGEPGKVLRGKKGPGAWLAGFYLRVPWMLTLSPCSHMEQQLHQCNCSYCTAAIGCFPFPAHLTVLMPLAGGCTLKKTKTAVVVGIYEEGVAPGKLNAVLVLVLVHSKFVSRLVILSRYV
jgi:hypothetical protein